MTTIPVRVMVLDSWEEVPMAAPSEMTIADLKRRALMAARVSRAPSEYLVKFRGAEVAENGTTVAGAGIVPNAGLIVLPRRRTAVK